MRSIKHFITLFISALRGTHKEFTSGSIDKAIFLLSIPMIFEMVMESAFAIVDVYFVSKVSTNAVATVGLTESVLMIVYSIAVGFTMATTAVVARRVGEKKIKRAASAGFQAICVAVVISVVLGVAGYFSAESILRIMGGSEELIAEGSGYTKVMFAGTYSVILLFLINGIFRGAGDAAISMRTLWLANGLNIILDPLLIFGIGPFPEMGVEGAAVATVIGRTTGVLYQVYHLVNGKSIIKIGYHNMVVKVKTIIELVKISLGGMGQFLVETASWIFLVRLMSHFGAEALAGYTIAFRVIVFTILPSWGLSNAAATLVGQNLGAKEPGRAEKSVWRTALYNMIFLGSLSIVFFLAADVIIGLFTQDPKVLDISVSALKIICVGYVFFAYGMVISQAFNGAGDTRTPMYINIFVFWLIQIPMAYLLAIVFDWRENGVFFMIAFSHSLQAIISILIFRRGKWKTIAV